MKTIRFMSMECPLSTYERVFVDEVITEVEIDEPCWQEASWDLPEDPEEGETK